jgi:superfamily II DNA helicase RecQ
MDDDTRELFEKLRSWRLDFARKNGWPAFRVLTDSTLAQVAHERPRTIEALLDIPGIGPKKAEQYGEPLLEAIRNS